MPRLERCSEVLLSVYGAATGSGPESFQVKALQRLNDAIEFESAWWGIMSPHSEGFTLRGSCRLELPEAFEQQWRCITHDDELARNATTTPRRTVRFDTRDLRSTPGLFALNSEHDIRHALCTSVRLDDEGDAFMFVSLFRRGKSRRFDGEDVSLKQFLMPHLAASWRLSMAHGLRCDTAGATASAFIDLGHRVIEADQRFTAVVRELWPNWAGPVLPMSLVEAVSALKGERTRSLGPLSVSVRPAGSLRRVSLSRVSALERLTPREADVAAQFATGRSYKQIARACELAPATVRHHLREVYRKLRVADKAQLANRISGADDWGTFT